MPRARDMPRTRRRRVVRGLGLVVLLVGLCWALLVLVATVDIVDDWTVGDVAGVVLVGSVGVGLAAVGSYVRKRATAGLVQAMREDLADLDLEVMTAYGVELRGGRYYLHSSQAAVARWLFAAALFAFFAVVGYLDEGMRLVYVFGPFAVVFVVMAVLVARVVYVLDGEGIEAGWLRRRRYSWSDVPVLGSVVLRWGIQQVRLTRAGGKPRVVIPISILEASAVDTVRLIRRLRGF
ncbi:hypothetical protein IM660_17950 [Ruania alkalisoli]|uniref:Uncharacterized protein n=1 Tax=Ruania alkalisoli TaxID=2779775 RepID=A0A7M1SSA0_9MICO|nr:hypothetical protein [Ruania alkalisoli]QOR70448.1 hypothetical protein IM660_17950 [Ruania alkalisoli]